MENQSTHNPPPESPDPAVPPVKEVVREIHHHHYRPGGIWRLFFGLLLVLVGAAYLAQNFGWLSGFDLVNLIFRIWPAFIILFGLSVLSRGTWVGTALSVVFTLVVVALIAFAFLWQGNPVRQVEKFTFDIAKESAAASADVTIKSGAASVTLSGGSKSLVSGSLESNLTRVRTSSEMAGGAQRVKISTEGDVRMPAWQFTNNLTATVAEDVPLALTVDAGASNLDLDLSSLMLESARINAGASKLRLTLGDKLDASAVEVDAGASSISISLPKSLGARLDVRAGLSSKSFPDFRQLNERIYESDNYASSTKKVNISLDAGVSGIAVTWR